MTTQSRPESRLVTLTEDEAGAMREVLAALAVIEDRGLRHDDVIEISRQVWADMLLRPAQRLRRIGSQLRLPENVR